MDVIVFLYLGIHFVQSIRCSLKIYMILIIAILCIILNKIIVIFTQYYSYNIFLKIPSLLCILPDLFCRQRIVMHVSSTRYYHYIWKTYRPIPGCLAAHTVCQFVILSVCIQKYLFLGYKHMAYLLLSISQA